MAHIRWLAIVVVLSGCAATGNSPIVGEEVMPPDGYIEMCIRSPSLKICNE